MEAPDEVVQAHMAVSQTENGKLLSAQEKDAVADAILTGKVSGIKSPQMREALVESLISLGVTSDYLAQRLREGLQAQEKKYFQFQGRVRDERDVVAWGPRHRYLTTAFKLLGLEGHGLRVQARNFVYKPMLRGGGEEVTVEMPKEAVLKRRMAAAKVHAKELTDDS